MYSTDPQPFPQPLLNPFLKSLSSLLNNARQPLWEVAAQVLGAVLSKKQFRSAVWQEEGCISGLVKALKASPTPQAQYWAGLALWELSFEEAAARGFDRYVEALHPGTELGGALARPQRVALGVGGSHSIDQGRTQCSMSAEDGQLLRL
jgi:V-type H+-transporting ATPase subunit H